MAQLTIFTLLIIGHYPGPVSNTYIANSFLPDSFDGYVNALS